MNRGDAVALTRRLVSIDSRNPSLVADGPGENEVAHALAQVLQQWGFAVELMETAPGRPNVIARIGDLSRRTLMFNGHLDVVGVEGMVHAPFDAFEVSGRIFGRGSTDMKGGVAAMCAAAVRAVDAGLEGGLVICAVTDEEYGSIGTSALIAAGIRADAAIVTEPTCMAIAPAHKGFATFEFNFAGRAAHGSRYDIGVDAIRHAGLLLTELDAMEREFEKRQHPLLGRASLHASSIEGGLGMSTYPDSCLLRVERRTLPGETTQMALQQMEAVCAKLREVVPNFNAGVDLLIAQPPSDVAVDAPIVRALESAMRECGEESRIAGLSAWTDAALLNDAGIPAICYGPGDIALAHAAEEYVAIEEIERATDVLTALATNWCNS